jgi:competence protein ComGC
MKRGSSEWTPIYMLVVIIIAAILLITLIKPLMQRAAASASERLSEAETAAKAASLFGLVFWNKFRR